MTDLSIIVVTWNTRKLVLDCLESIDRACAVESISVDVVVVDNGSDDDTADAIRARFSGATLLELSDNVGFAAGCNEGIRAARGRHLLLLNSDTVLLDGVLGHCVEYLDAHPEVAIVGPQLLNPDGSRQNSIHNFPIVATELIPKAVFQFLFPSRFPSRRSTGSLPIDVEALLGAALFVRRDVIESVGSLSEDYFFFLEETDWCWRLRESGWRVVYLPGASVTHLLGASSKKKNAALTRIEYHRSLYRFYRKHRGIGWMTVVLLLRATKSVFYVASQAPLALAGGRHLARWKKHRDVLLWHLRGCPARVGVAQLGHEHAVGETIGTTASN